MHRQLEKRLQMDTESPTNPDTPAIDRSPAAKMQAIQNDGSKPLPPHSRTGLPELTDLGPGNPLTDNAATVSEARQVPQTSMPCKSSSTQDTMTAQTIPKHDQKPTTPPTPWTGALECTWPARLPPPLYFATQCSPPEPRRHSRPSPPLPDPLNIHGRHSPFTNTYTHGLTTYAKMKKKIRYGVPYFKSTCRRAHPDEFTATAKIECCSSVARPNPECCLFTPALCPYRPGTHRDSW